MNTIQVAYINALLADAAYVENIGLGDINVARFEPRLTPTQANYLAANFAVLSSIESPKPLGNGFDAFVWQGKADTPYAGQVFVSMRGTQGLEDIADDIGLAASGVPITQVVDMVNWWLRITTPQGRQARQIQFQPQSGYTLVSPVAGTGEVSAMASITAVNGHSLGGYLATAFARLFGNQTDVQSVNTFNSAGFSNAAAVNVQNSYDQIASVLSLSGSFAATGAKQQNYLGANGINFTTNSAADIGIPGFNQYGQRVGLYQEDLLTGNAAPINNHSMYKLTDYLALGAALEKLDYNLTFSQLNAMVKAGSNDMAASYEGVLDGLRRMLVAPSLGSIPVGDVSDSAGTRVTYHQLLKHLTDNAFFKSLEGKVTIALTGANIGTQARARVGFEEIAALETLSPIVLSAAGAEGTAALESLWQSQAWDIKYQSWLADKASLQTGGAADAYTNEWIADRSAMLGKVIERNQKDTGGILPGTENLRYYDKATNTEVLVGAGSAQRIQYLFGGDAADTLDGQGFADHLYGGAGIDTFDGKGGNDYLEGNADNDTLDGGDGNDILVGGKGTDTYTFTGSFGKDTITDSDGLGEIKVGGYAITTTKAAGKRNVWTAKLGSNELVGMSVYDDARSSTGKKLVITRAGSVDNTITVNNFDLTQALGSDGYLGIKLDNTPQTIIKQGTGTNPFTDVNFNPAAVNGASQINEGGSSFYTVYLNVAAKAGDTLTLALPDLADKFKAILGDTTVDANGAVITLVEGQTEVSFALVQEGEITADGSAQLSVTYQGADYSATSNSWGINLKDTGEVANTYTGDQHGQILTAPETGNQSYNWNDTTWAADGTLVGGVVEEDYKDVILGSNNNDKISGLGANDALYGGGGNDQIDGGEGSDLIGGGAGSDSIQGSAGNDTILSATGLNVFQRPGPSATWDPTLSANGGSLEMDDAADTVDAGAGDDHVFASRGDDRIDGGTGADVLWGLAGNDIMEGGGGDDQLSGDGINAPNSYASTPGEAHGSDFLDGGEGNDTLVGFGKSDALYGGSGNDRIYGDGNAVEVPGDASYLAAQYHGDDYIDGEDGDDYVEGHGGADTIYGGTGIDTLWGDAADNLLGGEFHGADYIDGEDGNDNIVGGGAADTLYGGAGDDRIRGDSSGLLPWESGYLAGQYHADDYLDGEDGDDEMTGDGGADTLYGGAGNDVMYGDETLEKLAGEFHGDDYLDGEDGDDRLVGGDGDDTLYGGNGNDTLIGEAGADYMNGEAGNDSYEAGGGDTVVDASGTNTLTLLDANSYTVSATGSDLVLAFEGSGNLLVKQALTGSIASIDGVAISDWLQSRLSDDTDLQSSGEGQVLSGGAGDDELTAYHSGATLQGGHGNDRLLGLVGNANLSGGIGNDVISASGAFNFLSGGDGIDSLIAGLGDDTLDGGEGDDSLAGGAGGDTLRGGAGNDLVDGGDGDDLIYADRGADTLRGGSGLDTYVLGYGTGQATLEDSSQEGSVIELDASGLRLQSLTAKRSNDDLLVEVRGTDTSMRIKDYYGASQTSWVLKDSDGNSLSAQELIDASAPQWGSLRNNLLQDFKTDARGKIASQYYSQGYTQQADGGWYDSYAPQNIRRYLREDIFYREFTTQPLENNNWSQTVSSIHTYNDNIFFDGNAGDHAVSISDQLQLVSEKHITLGTQSAFNIQDGWIKLDWTLGIDGGYMSPWRYQSQWIIQPNSSFILGTQRERLYEKQRTDHASAEAFVFSDPGPAATAGSLPSYRQFDFYRSRTDYSVGEVMLADGDHTVMANELSAVVGGVGNNTIHDAGFAYGGTGNARLIGGGTLIAGTGDQYLENGRTMVVGDGHNTVVARTMSRSYSDPTDPYSWVTERPGSLILVDPNNAGMDLLVSDYRQQHDLDADGWDDVVATINRGGNLDPTGISWRDPKESYEHAGEYALAYISNAYFGTLDEARSAFNSLGFTFVAFEQAVRYVQPLPVLLRASNSDDHVDSWGPPSAYYESHPLETVFLSATDFVALQPFFGSGLPATTVSFGPGLARNDIALSWGEAVSPLDGRARVTLDMQWGADQGVRVMIPRSDDVINAAVQKFEFADGSVVWLADLIASAPPAPDFDVGYVPFYAGMGLQTVSAEATPVIQAAALASTDLAVRSEGLDLLISINNGQDSLRLTGWYGAGNAAKDVRMTLSDGEYLRYEELTSLGLTKDGSLGNMTLYGVPDFATTFIAGPNTTLIGASHMDTYVYNAGSGEVHITDPGGGTLRFGVGITSSMISLGLGSLMLTIGDQGDVIHLDGFDASQTDEFFSIDRLRFADGSQLTYDSLLQRGFDIRGTASADTLTGTSVNDRFHASAGIDTLQGGQGDDTYMVDDAGDAVIEALDEGNDQIQSSVSYTAPANVEAITLTGEANINATGNALDNHLAGNNGNNRLEGAAGNDVLDGSVAMDTMLGGQGDDTYYVDNTGDITTEKANEGTDTAISTVNRSLAAHVENLILGGEGAINGTGNSLNNVLIGNAAKNTLNGGAGADDMQGGAGDDTYYVDNIDDRTYEEEGQGTDRVISSISHTLHEYVEDLQLSGTANTDATGNELANKLTGNSGANTLTGGAGHDRLTGGLGADQMLGGEGDDFYELDNTADVVSELVGEGMDTVEVSVTYTLGSDVENLILTGLAGIDGTGNELNNVLQGNAADNTLTGGAGNDSLNGMKGLDILTGGAGNDTYLFEDDLDIIVEEEDGGRDTLISRLSAALAANVEDGVLLGSAISLTGNELSNGLTGNNAANTLDGGLGADVLIGGKGNDLYIVDSQADTVVENAAEGTDTVQSSVNYSLADTLENLTLTGTAEAGMGNALANKLTGNAESNKLWGGAGNDSLDGGAGADILMGGLGNDKYWVDSSDDLVVESALEGTDTVYASVSYALADNVEYLTLTGSDNINAIGNAGNNRLEGNAGNNVLFGGLGNDTYVWGRGSGQDIIANFDAGKPSGDTVQLGAGIAEADLAIARQGNDLILSINGSTDQLTVANYFENAGKGANALEKIRFADGTSWNHAAVLSRTSAEEGSSAAPALSAEVRAGNPTTLFDAPDPAQTQTSDATTTPQTVAESIAAAKERFEQGLQNLKYGADEQGSLSRSEFAERRALPLLWNLQDALLDMQLAKNPDGRFTADISMDSRGSRDLGLSVGLLGGVSGMNGRLDQVARPAQVQQFDLAQMV